MADDPYDPTDEFENGLPSVSKRESDDNSATAWFENGAKLRYRVTQDGRVLEETFGPSDPHSVWESANVTGSKDEDPDPGEYLEVSLGVYRSDMDNMADLKSDWTPLYEAFQH